MNSLLWTVLVILVLLVFLALSAIRIVQQYERGVIFVLGRLIGAKGPGLFLVPPLISHMRKVDLRIVTLTVPPQEVISRDNVTIKVTAVLYFYVVDPIAAIVNVVNFNQATTQIGQTTLRNVLGQAELDELLTERLFFFPVLSLIALSLQASSVGFLISKKEQYHTVEIALMVLHFGVYLGILFFVLGIWQAVLFLLVHQLLSGLYLGSIFAPNHKGMPMLGKESDLGFLYRQVVTARNVKAHPVTDFWYGGLNYQIEHHLFPSMPRNRLREAQCLIRPFCQEHAIPYYETSMLQPYREILQHLHQVSAPLRS